MHTGRLLKFSLLSVFFFLIKLRHFNGGEDVSEVIL